MKNWIVVLFAVTQSFSQFTTATVALTNDLSIKIDTNPNVVTLTLKGPATTWIGIGFGGSTMGDVQDMFIWNDTSDRDFTPSGGLSIPTADEQSRQSWNILTDNVQGNERTIIATRNLISPADYNFLNNSTSIPIIYALSTSTTIGFHQGAHSTRILTRTPLGTEDFSLNASSIYPNPSNGNFVVKTKSALDKVDVYTQTGVFVKSISVNANTETSVNISGLSAGVYLLELKGTSDKAWKKVIVE